MASLEMTEVRRSASVGGEAVFATVNIRQGTRLAAEIPLVIVPPVPDKKEVAEFCKAMDRLPERKSAEMAELFCHPSVAEKIKKGGSVPREVYAFYRSKKWKDSKGAPLQGKQLQKTVKKTVNLCSIYLTNNVQLGLEGKYGSGIFSFFCRIRHSCVPNVYSSWNPTMNRLIIHATHDIKAGDLICVNYAGNVCRTRQQRAFSLFTTWGIICNCMACTEPSIDQLRRRMLVLDQALAAYICGASKETDFAAIHNIPRITQPLEALEAAEELVRLLRRQRLYGMELCKVYRECSKYALDSGASEKALHYARKELEHERLLIGTETSHLKEDLYGAAYWLEHVQERTSRGLTAYISTQICI
ncbi:SET domain-containing protein [Hypoxylon crocopeplum]|nr:SET domain-containing protein [Hypoxylon crocopeplum]